MIRSRKAVRAQRKQKTPRKIVIKKTWIIGIFVITIIIFILNIPRLITIKSISCESQFGPCSSLLNQKLDEAQGMSLWASTKYVSEVFEKNVFVKKHSSRFQIPDKIVVDVVERKPEIALVSKNNTQEFFIIDTEGYIINTAENNQLPVIVAENEQNFAVGTRVKDDIIFCKGLLSRSFSLFGSKLAFYNGNYLALDLPAGQTVVFPITGDQDVLFGSLSLILSQLNTGRFDSIIKIIDLRYKNPVLRMQNYEQEQNSSGN